MRTTSRRSPLRHRSLLAVALSAGLVLAACAGTTDAPDVVSPPPAPAPTPAPDDPNGTDGNDEVPDATVEVAAYLIRTGPTEFYVEPVPVRIDDVGDAVSARITAAISALLDMAMPDDPDLTTSVPDGTTLQRVTVEDGVATLDLSGAIVGSSGGSSQEMTLAQQLAYTAQVDPSVTGILLFIDGAPVDELWGHLDWSRPVEPEPSALSPITVTRPAAGETVSVGDITFGGEATVFEGTVVVMLLGEDGEVVEEDFVTATVGGPERGTWEWRVTLPAPGLYTMVAGETDPSEGEGRPPFETTRTFRAAG